MRLTQEPCLLLCYDEGAHVTGFSRTGLVGSGSYPLTPTLSTPSVERLGFEPRTYRLKAECDIRFASDPKVPSDLLTVRNRHPLSSPSGLADFKSASTKSPQGLMVPLGIEPSLDGCKPSVLPPYSRTKSIWRVLTSRHLRWQRSILPLNYRCKWALF